MGRSLLVAALLLGIGLVPAAARACAGCRNPNVAQSRGPATQPVSGGLTVSASLDTTALWVSHPAGCEDAASCTELPVQPAHTHDLFMFPAQLTAAVDWAVSDHVGLELHLPVRLVHVTAAYETPDGRPYEPLDEGIHHRDETIVGLGDPLAGVRTTFSLGDFWLTARAGVSLPLGSTEPDPFALGDRGLAHQHVQLGTGTFDPALGLDLTRPFAESEWSLYAQGRASLYENSHGFQAGPRALVGVAGGYKPSTEWLIGGLVEGAFEGAETWSGLVRQDGNLGRSELLLGATAQWRGPQTTFGVSLRTLLYRYIPAGDEDPGELDAPLTLGLNAAWTLP